MIQETFRMNDAREVGMNKLLKKEIMVGVNVELVLKDKFGNIKSKTLIHNTVPDAGVYAIMDQLLDAPSLAVPSHMELGTGTPGATKLGTYIAGSRTALSSKTRDSAVVTMVATFAAGVGTGSVTEAGVFNSASEDSGTMYMSASFGVITKAADDSLTITWTLTGSEAV
jgi:hypothetical protein